MIVAQRPAAPEAAVEPDPAPEPVARSRKCTGERLYLAALTLAWLAIAGTALADGWAYYRLPLHDKPYAPDYAVYKPSGERGHGYGVVGSAMMLVGVALYAARKRVPALARFGKLKYWLQFHIFLCTLGPFLVLLHTSFKVGGLVSIAFWSMTLVVFSGIFGRYVYARIPKTLNGRFLSRAELDHRLAGLAAALAEASGRPPADVQAFLRTLPAPASRGVFGAASRRHTGGRRLVEALGLDVAAVDRQRVEDLLDAHRRLARQIRLLQPFQRLFGYWHLFHLPLALVMFVIMIVHIVVAALFGYAWVA